MLTKETIWRLLLTITQSMLDELSTDDRRIIVSALLPRGSVDLEPYNTRIKTLCTEKDIDYIDHYNSFLLASGDIADSYFHRDRVHPNSSGIRKMLKNIDAVQGITNSHTGYWPYVSARRTSTYLKRSGFSSAVAVGTNGRGYRNRAKYCHICLIGGMTHMTAGLMVEALVRLEACRDR